MDKDTDLVVLEWEARMDPEWEALTDRWVITEWEEIPGDRLRRREEVDAGAV